MANYNQKLRIILYHWQLSMGSFRLCVTCLLHIKQFVVNKSVCVCVDGACVWALVEASLSLCIALPCVWVWTVYYTSYSSWATRVRFCHSWAVWMSWMSRGVLRDMSHIWISHVTHMHEYAWLNECDVTLAHGPPHGFRTTFISHIWPGHVTHMNVYSWLNECDMTRTHASKEPYN